MEQVDLFAPQKTLHPYQEVSDRLWALARRKVYLGSSSWKYPSWKGRVYVEDYRSKKDFEQRCLEEYGKIFPAVGGDFSFYNWPRSSMVKTIDSQTPQSFKIALKCTEFITLKRFPQLARWGANAGHENPDFLNSKLFKEKFLDAVTPLQKNGKLAPIILEFTEFPRGSFADWTEFASALEVFFNGVRRLARSPFEYGVEIRTRDFLHDDFYAALKAMGVVPVLNSWTRMPPLEEQWELFKKYDFPFVEVRAVMRPGRTHDEAVLLFNPYDRNKETLLPIRKVFLEIMEWGLVHRRPIYIFVNNHVEGCAHQTIAETVAMLDL
jgi:uncharacterized protein YecE (DUF72 family)